MSVKVLVVGVFIPDSMVRWLSDGMVYAGAKVVRCGVADFDPYPDDERPRLHDSPPFAPGKPAPTSLNVYNLARYFSRERGFTPDLVFLQAWDGLTLDDSGVPDSCAIVASNDNGVAVCKGGLRNVVKTGPAIQWAADPYVFRLSRRQADPLGPVAVEVNLGIDGPNVVEIPSLIGERAKLFARTPFAVMRTYRHVFEARAAGCPVVVGTDIDYLRNEALTGDTVYPVPPSVVVEHAVRVLHGETWMHRAIDILRLAGFEPGPMPRL